MKKNTWNVKRLVDDSFVPSARQTSKLYSRLTDFLYTCPIAKCILDILKKDVYHPSIVCAECWEASITYFKLQLALRSWGSH